MDALNPGDVVILATPPAFRWVMFKYAIEKGLHVFMEKPVSVDGPTSVKMFELGKQAAAKGLKVAVGLMCRHCTSRKELFKRIKDGQIGDLTLMRAYRLAGQQRRHFRSQSRKIFQNWLIRSSDSTRSCGQAVVRTATSSSTTLTKLAG